MRQIAPTYVEEGIQTFLSSFNDEHILSLMKEQHLLMLGAFDEKLVGVIGIRDLKDIQSLFVDPTYQGQHVGTKLLKSAKQLMYGDIYVNSAPSAETFYRSQGFQRVHDEQVVHGIRFVPMVYHSVNVEKFGNYDQVHDFSKSKRPSLCIG
ncbi:MAG: GNAT family N-acetyltransferase [Coprobacillus cateniformis]